MDRQKEVESIKNAISSAKSHIQNAEEMLKAIEATPEPKEPETFEELLSAGLLQNMIFTVTADSYVSKPIHDFAKRLLIADYCGRREFVNGKDNWYVMYDVHNEKWQVVPDCWGRNESTNYFPTKEAAEKYLKICQNSNLL